MSLSLVASVLSIGGGFPTENREISDKAQCRMSYARSVRVLSVALSLRVQACHRERLRGNLPAAIDCSDPWSWDAAGYTVGHEGLEHDLYRYALESELCTATVDTPDQVGYLSCPAPCDAVAIDSFAAFGVCLECLNHPLSVNAWQATQGSPPVTGDGRALRCQGAVGRAVVRYVSKLMKLQAGCEFKHEVSKDGYENLACIDIGADGHPLSTRINRFRARMVDSITRRCSFAEVASLVDSCAGDGAAIGECTVAAVEQWAAAIHQPAYPPLPPP